MEEIAVQLRNYLADVLGIRIRVSTWPQATGLPFFLQDRYSFYQTEILGLDCVLMVDSGPDATTPALVRKHQALIGGATEQTVVYVRDTVTSYDRKGLIEQKVPFIVPGNQLYLPTLGIDLREHFRSLRFPTKTVSPATQAVVMRALLRGANEEFTIAGLAEELRYSAMTISRAFDELASIGIGQSRKPGRERCLRLPEQKRELWTKALPFLRSPVRKRHFIAMAAAVETGPAAGLTALAHYSMLAAPENPVSAMLRNEWKRVKHVPDVTIAPRREPGATEIEVWSYDPNLFARDGVVDRLSLYLSLRDDEDERVQAALEEMMEEMMEGMPW